jgi:hypothetical protein
MQKPLYKNTLIIPDSQRIYGAGRIFSIPTADFLIVGDEKERYFISMREIKVFHGHAEMAEHDKAGWKALTPEMRLDLVETLRLSAGKYLYEYPSRFRRVVRVTRKAQG